MENKINIAELLKDCPKGMELDCTMYEGVTLIYIQEGYAYPIKIETPEGQVSLNKYGCYSNNKHAKCVIFPKGKTTWEGFHKPFKDGDIITDIDENNTFILHYDNGEFYDVHCALMNDILYIYKSKNNWVYNRREFRFATEEEKQKLFDAIKANGYRWNAETKTLEKLPKFKVGDRIRKENNNSRVYTINGVYSSMYGVEGRDWGILIEEQDDWELVPNKFDITTLVPFESRVLVRDYDNRMWMPTFWGKRLEDDSNCSYLTTNGCYKYCIPYEGNEYLLGTSDDCDDFYKTWEK